MYNLHSTLYSARIYRPVKHGGLVSKAMKMLLFRQLKPNGYIYV
jgi:hypothetical protein